MPNQLKNAKSPYLLQHADNPVDWLEWSDEVLEKAKAEQKIIIVSIGYSACHWCHVMAHESFEDEATAEIMNNNFINIKIDREERPDLDAIYMDACQLINGNGGWPLNAFTLPDGSPFHAGTYFKKHQWQNVLMQIAQLWKTEPEKVLKYAADLKEGIVKSSTIAKVKSENDFNLEKVLQTINPDFDTVHGGFTRAPKFPMPVAWEMLLQAAIMQNDSALKVQCHLTLAQMAQGGIYDWVEGGFARYSVDEKWFAPHFEKMLYDNAQLISLYSKAGVVLQEDGFTKVAAATADFVLKEWRAKDNGFYSALDADSEGVEGKYYCITDAEIDALDIPEAELFRTYFQISKSGNWEHGLNILYPILAAAEFEKQYQVVHFKAVLAQWKSALLAQRNTKVKPGLDDKQNTTWNALLLAAFCDVYVSTEDQKYAQAAENLQIYLQEKCFATAQGFHIVKNNKAYIAAFLEDFSTTIASFIRYYEVFQDEKVLLFAQKLLNQAIKLFYQPESGFFNMASKSHHAIIPTKIEVTDNVIPSANSIMCENLLKMGLFFEQQDWINMAEEMLETMKAKATAYPNFYAKWVNLLMQKEKGYPMVVSNIAVERHKAFKLFAVAIYQQDSALPCVQTKPWTNKASLYLCANQICQSAVSSWNDINF